MEKHASFGSQTGSHMSKASKAKKIKGEGNLGEAQSVF